MDPMPMPQNEKPKPGQEPRADQLYRINSVEIFSAGKWNGDQYTTEDLDEMVRAFEATKEHVRPFLKLGHSEEQKLLEAEGLPAAGWVESIYRKGNKLMADFFDMPSKIYDLIQKKAYRKVSCEIYVNCEIEAARYRYMVGAVALLGAETPGVMNLGDILANYRALFAASKKLYASQQELATIKAYQFKTEEVQNHQGDKPMSKTERELELESKLAESEAKAKEAAEKATALETENKKFAVEKQEQAEKLFQLEVDKTVDGLVGEKLINPGMKPYVAALLGREKVEFSIEGKTFKKSEVVKELLKLFKAAGGVNLDEGSSVGQDGNQEKPVGQDAILKEVEEYAAQHKVSFSQAYRIVAPKHEKALAARPMAQEE